MLDSKVGVPICSSQTKLYPNDTFGGASIGVTMQRNNMHLPRQQEDSRWSIAFTTKVKLGMDNGD